MLGGFPQQAGRILEPCGDGLQPTLERGEVAGEQDEDPITDVIDGRGALLPLPLHLVVEDRAAGAEHGDLALERELLRQGVRIEGVQVGHVPASVGDALVDRRSGARAKASVMVVDPERRGQDRVGRHECVEAGAHQLLVRRVGGPVGGRHAATGTPAAPISTSAPRTTRRTRSISDRSTP